MLVLARKAGEAVQIGDEVELRVLSVSGKRVRLGLICPRGITIMRAEIICRAPVTADDSSPDAAPIATDASLLRATASARRVAALKDL